MRLIFFGRYFFSQIAIIILVSIIAVNIEEIIPIDNVTANPLIDPLPKVKRKNATIKVVRLESIIVLYA